MFLTFVIPGPAVPLERARHAKGRTYTPPRSVAYQRHVRACAGLSVSRLPGWDLTCRMSIAIDYWPQDRTRRDIDNVGKQIFDGLNGIVWEDDWQADEMHIMRHWDGSQPRVVVSVVPLPAMAARAPRLERSPSR